MCYLYFLLSFIHTQKNTYYIPVSDLALIPWLINNYSSRPDSLWANSPWGRRIIDKITSTLQDNYMNEGHRSYTFIRNFCRCSALPIKLTSQLGAGRRIGSLNLWKDRWQWNYEYIKIIFVNCGVKNEWSAFFTPQFKYMIFIYS